MDYDWVFATCVSMKTSNSHQKLLDYLKSKDMSEAELIKILDEKLDSPGLGGRYFRYITTPPSVDSLTPLTCRRLIEYFNGD